jgi:DNA-binding transcriptional regulator YiaG
VKLDLEEARAIGRSAYRAPESPDAALVHQVFGELHVTRTRLARALGVDHKDVARWADGMHRLPRPVRRILRLLLAHPPVLEQLEQLEQLEP